MDGGRGSGNEHPDVDVLAAEVSAEITAAFEAERQDFREQVAAARGEKGYIQRRPSTVDKDAKRAASSEEIAPLMAAQASKLREKVASLGLTPEEVSLLDAAEHWLRRHGQEGAGSEDA